MNDVIYFDGAIARAPIDLKKGDAIVVGFTSPFEMGVVKMVRRRGKTIYKRKEKEGA